MDKVLKLESAFFANKSIKAEEKKLSVYQPLHWHDFYEIEYIIDGDGEYIINGNSMKIKAGTLFFSTPTDIHEIKFSRKTHLVNVSFTSHYIDDKLITPTLSAIVSDCKDDSYLFMLKNILNAVDSNMANRTLYLRSMLSAVLITISNGGNSISTSKTHISSHKNLREIIFFINKHFAEPLDLNVLSEITNLTPKYLSKKFIEMSGITLSQYISDVRLTYAKNLVTSSDVPINEICFKSGFNAPSHFSRCFKAKFKMSPNQMRAFVNKSKN